MASIWLTRQACTLAVRLLPALLLAALPGPAEPPGGGSLVGQLLVAAPDMSDPHFAETVILMVRQDNNGAFGIVINQPMAKRSLASLLEELGESDSDVQGSVDIFAGGPVEPSIGFIVHSAEYHRAETLAIDGQIALTSSPAVLRDIGHGAGPAKSLIAFGYTGWGPGQLEAEMAHHDWFTEPEDPKLVFDEDRTKVWKEALSRRSRDL